MRPVLLALALSLPAWAEPLVLEGEVPDGGDFFTLAFDVPPGTAEVEVRHDDLSSANILDFGLLMPDGGFRGWGGGNPEPTVVGEFAASRSYLAGPLPPGEWQVLVGKAFVPQRPARYRVEVETRTAPTLAPQRRIPYAAAAPLEVGRRWYAGDLHVHSVESGDARPPIEEIAAFAEGRGLDFVSLSDHNTVSQLDFMGEVQARYQKLLLVPSVELTTYAGHFGGFGATRFVPFWRGPSRPAVEEMMREFVDQGAVVTLNHPTLDLGTFCIGCAWKLPLSPGLAGAIEVGVGGLDETGALFDESALLFWEALADQNLRLAAVGGSDDHRAGVGSNQTQSAIGSPTTLIEADALTVEGLAAGLRAQRTVVKLRGPDDPMVVLDQPSGISGPPERLVTRVRARVTGGEGFTLAWVENGAVAREVPIDADRFSATFELVAPEGKAARVRAEVRLAGAPRTVTSHLWLSAEPGGGEPISARRTGPRSCLGCGASGAGAASAAAGLLALGLAARRRRGGGR